MLREFTANEEGNGKMFVVQRDVFPSCMWVIFSVPFVLLPFLRFTLVSDPYEGTSIIAKHSPVTKGAAEEMLPIQVFPREPVRAHLRRVV